MKYGGETATPLDQKEGKAEVSVEGKGVKVVWTTDLGTLTQILGMQGRALLVSYDLQLARPAWQALFCG